MNIGRYTTILEMNMVQKWMKIVSASFWGYPNRHRSHLKASLGSSSAVCVQYEPVNYRYIYHSPQLYQFQNELACVIQLHQLPVISKQTYLDLSYQQQPTELPPQWKSILAILVVKIHVVNWIFCFAVWVYKSNFLIQATPEDVIFDPYPVSNC